MKSDVVPRSHVLDWNFSLFGRLTSYLQQTNASRAPRGANALNAMGRISLRRCSKRTTLHVPVKRTKSDIFTLSAAENARTSQKSLGEVTEKVQFHYLEHIGFVHRTELAASFPGSFEAHPCDPVNLYMDQALHGHSATQQRQGCSLETRRSQSCIRWNIKPSGQVIHFVAN
jgi:hypothetical protein